jgi:hypothetical protein
MKTGPDALGTTPTIPGAQNLKIGPDALGTTPNDSRIEKYEN